MRKLVILFLICSCSNGHNLDEGNIKNIINRDYWEFKKLAMNSNHFLYEMNDTFTKIELDSIKIKLDRLKVNWAVTTDGKLLVPKDRINYSTMTGIYWNIKKTPFEKKRDSLKVLGILEGDIK